MNDINKTSRQWWSIVTNNCHVFFLAKIQEYSTSWAQYTIPYLIQELFAITTTLRKSEEKRSYISEQLYVEMIVYCILALIRLDWKDDEISSEQLETLFTQKTNQAHQLMMDKNHDYGEAWRSMRLSSLTDLMLMKLFRIQQIDANYGETLVSEGTDANYLDILNYSIFALIRIEEIKDATFGD